MIAWILAVVLGATLHWNPVEVDIEGNPETVIASEIELLSDAGVRLDSIIAGPVQGDISMLVAGRAAGAYALRVRVSDAAGNWSTWSTALPYVVGPSFIRGDANRDGLVDIADPIRVLLAMFSDRSLTCLDAADVNDDGRVDIADPIRTLLTLFGAQTAVPPPFPDSGQDPTADRLGCSN